LDINGVGSTSALYPWASSSKDLLTAPSKFCYSSFAAPLADLGLQGGVVTTVNMMMYEELDELFVVDCATNIDWCHWTWMRMATVFSMPLIKA